MLKRCAAGLIPAEISLLATFKADARKPMPGQNTLGLTPGGKRLRSDAKSLSDAKALIAFAIMK
jgi:hypothetical protein